MKENGEFNQHEVTLLEVDDDLGCEWLNVFFATAAKTEQLKEDQHSMLHVHAKQTGTQFTFLDFLCVEKELSARAVKPSCFSFFVCYTLDAVRPTPFDASARD